MVGERKAQITAESSSPRVDRPSKNPHGTEYLQISTKVSLTLKFKFLFFQVFATAPPLWPQSFNITHCTH